MPTLPFDSLSNDPIESNGRLEDGKKNFDGSLNLIGRHLYGSIRLEEIDPYIYIYIYIYLALIQVLGL